MKILVDSTIAFADDWYELIPIVISNKNQDWYDTNNHDFSNETNFNEYKTSYLSPIIVKNAIKEKTIIFTAPSSLNNQYDSYKKNIKSKNVLILEGTAFINQKDKVKDILRKYDDFDIIKNEIDKLNKSVEYHAVILDFKDIPKKGQINALTRTFLKISKLKALLHFSDKKWRIIRVASNGSKLIEHVTKGLYEINLVGYDYRYDAIKKYITKMKIKNYYKKITFYRSTNAMVINEGKSFLAIF